MLQILIVALVVLAAAFYLIRRCFPALRRQRGAESGCGACSACRGCAKSRG